MSLRVRRTVAAASFLVMALAAAACGGSGQPIAAIDWSETVPRSGQVSGGAVRVTASDPGGTFPLATVEHPAVPGDGYVVVGEVRYEGVDGRAFLEMWSAFPGGERYFTRTVDEEGPQAWISGSSDWRPFELPFSLQGGPGPERITIGVVLPGAGSVDVGRLELLPLGGDQGAWWSERAGGLVGGIGGALIGILGGLIGWLVSRGRARRYVLGAMQGCVALGVALLCLGVAALVSSQPYGVAYPILLPGVILVVVFGGLLPGTRRAYAGQELRRMRAFDQS